MKGKYRIYGCDEAHKDRVKEILDKANETLTIHPRGQEGCGRSQKTLSDCKKWSVRKR